MPDYAMTVIATVTGGWIVGFVALAVLLACCGAMIFFGQPLSHDSYERGLGLFLKWAGIVLIPIVIGVWWWGSAFTTSGDYHAWNVKEGTVEQISKRIVPAGDKGIQERFVFRFSKEGGLYGVDDTRASLVKRGDKVSLKCKKDYQWGVPREAHGWACRWNTIPASIQGGN